MQTRIAEIIWSALLRGAFAVMLVWAFAGAVQAQTCNGLPYTKLCCVVNGSDPNIPEDCIGTVSHDVISVHPNCFNQDVVIVGLEDKDDITGGNGNDTICGDRDESNNGANDKINGGLGNDVLKGCGDNCTGDLGDQIIGGDGNDEIWGGGPGSSNTGNDRLFGSKGCDTIYGQDGNDKLWGGENEDPNDPCNALPPADRIDKLFGGPGNDQLVGQTGDDLLEGEDGNDVLNGNEGSDYLIGGDGKDRCNGGLGDDQIKSCEKQDGGFGCDRLEASCDVPPAPDLYVVKLLGGGGNDSGICPGGQFGPFSGGLFGSDDPNCEDWCDGGPGIDYCEVTPAPFSCDVRKRCELP